MQKHIAKKAAASAPLKSKAKPRKSKIPAHQPTQFTYALTSYLFERRTTGWYVARAVSSVAGEKPKWGGPFQDLENACVSAVRHQAAELADRHTRAIETRYMASSPCGSRASDDKGLRPKPEPFMFSMRYSIRVGRRRPPLQLGLALAPAFTCCLCHVRRQPALRAPGSPRSLARGFFPVEPLFPLASRRYASSSSSPRLSQACSRYAAFSCSSRSSSRKAAIASLSSFSILYCSMLSVWPRGCSRSQSGRDSSLP